MSCSLARLIPAALSHVHQPQGIGDHLGLRGVSPFFDLPANEIFDALRDGDVHLIPLQAR